MHREIVDWSTSNISGPDLLGDVVALVSASHDKRLAQGKSPWPPGSFNPWLFEQFGNACFEFVELLTGQA
jgi:hypothetical protein